MSLSLSGAAFDAFINAHPHWSRNDEEITRTYVFEDFNEALGFVVRIGVASEVADHHPDIDIRWNKVTCVLSTHSEGALTDKDLELAIAFDAIAGHSN
jgi:4a-hydroxytetrahydrobiopterin dehydratase